MIASVFVASTILAAGQLVAGHGAIVQAQGNLGGLGSALSSTSNSMAAISAPWLSYTTY